MTQELVTRERLRIEGRGPVAIALRLFLARQGFASEVVEHDPFTSDLPDWLASRPLALSLGSWQLLSRIAMLPAGAPIRTVEVSIVGRAGRTRLRCADLDTPALGYVLRYGVLHRSLIDGWARLAGHDRAAHPLPQPIADEVRAPTSAAPVDDVALVVIADGEPPGGSLQQRDWRVYDFDQSALLAEIVAERDGNGVAFERFTDEGPLALLPLPEPHRHALVWCGKPGRTSQRAALPAHEFDRELRERFGRLLGALHVDGMRHQLPLQRRIDTGGGDPRRVSIGNAAQTLHPVAGQGLNLGIRDAFELAQRLGEARGSGRRLDCAMEGFRRARLLDRATTIGITDSLARLFTLAPLAPVESIALGALDLIAPVRNRFARALMYGLRSG